ncbi:hypothetical protein LZ30DRAFT_684051 [Colletotrichum cereale]|nr:hypothetical protein LZ30DRAFT_684051 [Colletotrichum cereale]
MVLLLTRTRHLCMAWHPVALQPRADLPLRVLVDSLDDCIFSGLVTHGQELFDTLKRYCDPSPSFAGSLVRLLREKRIDEFATPREFATYVEFIRLCVEPDKYSMALTCILFETVERSNPEVTGKVLPMGEAMDWTRLLKQVRELANHKKRPIEERPASPEQYSGRDTEAIREVSDGIDDGVGAINNMFQVSPATLLLALFQVVVAAFILVCIKFPRSRNIGCISPDIPDTYHKIGKSSGTAITQDGH